MGDFTPARSTWPRGLQARPGRGDQGPSLIEELRTAEAHGQGCGQPLAKMIDAASEKMARNVDRRGAGHRRARKPPPDPPNDPCGRSNAMDTTNTRRRTFSPGSACRSRRATSPSARTGGPCLPPAGRRHLRWSKAQIHSGGRGEAGGVKLCKSGGRGARPTPAGAFWPRAAGSPSNPAARGQGRCTGYWIGGGDADIAQEIYLRLRARPEIRSGS